MDLTIVLSHESIRLFPIINASLTTCAGYAPTMGRRCHNLIAYDVRNSSMNAIEELTREPVDLDRKEFRNMLDMLASDLLCRRNHQYQAHTIRDALVRALREFWAMSSMPLRSIYRSIPILDGPSQIDLTIVLPYESICLLPITDASYGICSGYAPSMGRQCHNQIAWAVRNVNIRAIQELTCMPVNLEGKKLCKMLDTLASDLLCRRDHQYQAPTIREALVGALQKFRGTSNPPPTSIQSIPTIPPFGQVLIDANEQPSPSPPISTRQSIPTTSPSICHVPVDTTQQPPCSAEDKPLTLKCAGIIYMYRSADNEELIKIGYSNNVMGEFWRGCHRTAILIKDPNQRAISHVYLAEQLVLARLRHLRRREIGSGKGRSGVDEDKTLGVVESVRSYIEAKYGSVDQKEDDNTEKYEGRKPSGWVPAKRDDECVPPPPQKSS